MPSRRLFLLILVLAALLPGAACAQQARCPEGPTPEGVPVPADPELARVARERPDSLVGVLVRTTRELDEHDTAELAACGLQVGTVVGDIVTGRVRAAEAERLARHPLVVYLEFARTVELPGPPVPPDSPAASPRAPRS